MPFWCRHSPQPMYVFEPQLDGGTKSQWTVRLFHSCIHRYADGVNKRRCRESISIPRLWRWRSLHVHELSSDMSHRCHWMPKGYYALHCHFISRCDFWVAQLIANKNHSASATLLHLTSFKRTLHSSRFNSRKLKRKRSQLKWYPSRTYP